MTPQQIEALNIAGQCRATASSPLAKNILVDEGNGLLTELLLDAARIIEALAQPEQEPVAWFSPSGNLYKTRFHATANGEQVVTPLYTAPPQRKPLTPDQVFAIADQHPVEGFDPDIMAFARAIEAAHGIKENT